MHLLLALASCNVDGTVNGTTAFVRSWWSKWGTTWLFLACDATDTAVCNPLNQWHKNGITAFLTSRQLKGDAKCLFMSFAAIGTGISVRWNQHDHQWYNCIPLVNITEMRCNMNSGHVMSLASHDADDINGTIAFLRSRSLKICLIWTQCNQHYEQEHKYTYISHYLHTFHIICPSTNMPVTVHYYRHLHIISTLLYTEVQKIKLIKNTI